MYNSTLGWRVIKKKKKTPPGGGVRSCMKQHDRAKLRLSTRGRDVRVDPFKSRRFVFKVGIAGWPEVGRPAVEYPGGGHEDSISRRVSRVALSTGVNTLYPSRASMARIRKPRPDSGHGFQVNVLKT